MVSLSQHPSLATTMARLATRYWSWTTGDLHLKTGNLGLSDGSVQTTTIAALQTSLSNATNSYTTTFIYYTFPQ